MLQRREWLNLNGLWEFALLARDQAQPERFEDQILVPFPIESALSGVGKSVSPRQRAWYRRHFVVPEDWLGQRLLLHFEAVDWETTVWVNGQKVGHHCGGYDPFTLDITAALTDKAEQNLVVAVWDPTDQGPQPRGKQVLQPAWIYYTAVTGIWLSVWLEPVGAAFIADLRTESDIDRGELRVRVQVDGVQPGDILRAALAADSDDAQTLETGADQELRFQISSPRLWSPDDPFLYDLQLTLVRDGLPLDSVSSYAGLRKIALGKDDKGITRIFLNNRFVFQIGLLDQGYWPDGLYTPPCEQGLRYDLEVTKKLGYNMLRKHVKVESRRFYTLCDRLGLLVWQDMPSGEQKIRPGEADIERTPESAAQYNLELGRLISSLYNHPCIVMWVPFNEGWGQFETERVVETIRRLDPTRLIDNASGWVDRGVGDVIDVHVYPGPESPVPEAHRAAVLGEYGGLGVRVPGHLWKDEDWAHQVLAEPDELMARYREMIAQIWQLREDPGLSAVVYTQTTDVETEVNGLMTYDRRVIKLEEKLLRAIHLNEGLSPDPLS